MKKLYFITNLLSGKNAIRGKLAAVIDIFTAGGYEVTVRTTQGRQDATAAAEYACLSGEFDLIVCSGGDGTLNEVVQGLMHSCNPLPLGYIPCGSTNDFSKSLKIPSDIEAAAHLIMSSRLYSCDIGTFNSRNFLYVAAFGAFSATVYETPQNLKNRLGHLAYVLHGMTLVNTIRPLHLRIDCDGQILEDEYVFGMICNTASVGGILKLKDFRLDDGQFEAILVRMPSNIIHLQKILSSLLNIQEDVDPEYVRFFRFSSMHIISDEEIPWTLDGEYGGTFCDTEIGICHRAVNLCVGENAPKNDEEICIELPLTGETSE